MTSRNDRVGTGVVEPPADDAIDPDGGWFWGEGGEDEKVVGCLPCNWLLLVLASVLLAFLDCWFCDGSGVDGVEELCLCWRIRDHDLDLRRDDIVLLCSKSLIARSSISL